MSKRHPKSRDVRGKKNPRWRPAEERFWQKVDTTGECWEWRGRTNKDGYGSFKDKGKTWLAHRWIMKASSDTCVLHHCDNPSCVRPGHLYFGDRLQNAKDRDRRWRNGYAQIKASDVASIYLSDEPQIDIAARYGVSRMVVGRIKRDESYKHITDRLRNEKNRVDRDWETSEAFI